MVHCLYACTISLCLCYLPLLVFFPLLPHMVLVSLHLVSVYSFNIQYVLVSFHLDALSILTRIKSFVFLPSFFSNSFTTSTHFANLILIAASFNFPLSISEKMFSDPSFYDSSWPTYNWITSASFLSFHPSYTFSFPFFSVLFFSFFLTWNCSWRTISSSITTLAQKITSLQSNKRPR